MKRTILGVCLALAACGQESGAPSPAPSGHARPAFDPAKFGERCMVVPRRTDTDPAVLAADQRTCDCMERTLKPEDFDLLLSSIESGPQHPEKLYARYGMSEADFTKELHRAQAEARSCLKH
jgi:hypothetical protein